MRLALLTAFAASLALGQSPCPQCVLERYLQTSDAHPSVEREESVEVQIEASLPRLHKHGTMRGWKKITRAGQTVYSGLRFSGDKLIRNDVISRYLAADVAKRSDRRDLAIASGNYRFQSVGKADYNGRTAQVFRVIPRRKRAGLFRGELWLDEATALPLREWGDFVKSPSRFLSHPRFVRDYNLAEDRSQPRRLILTAHASFIGDVQMTILYSDGDARDGAKDGPSGVGSDVEQPSASNP